MKMKRSLTIAMLLVLLACTTALAADSINGMYEGFPIVKVVVNGVEIKSDVPGINFYDRTLLPVRAIAETLGLEVGWDDATWTATLTAKNATNATSTSGFEFKNVSIKPSSLGTEIIGEVTNKSGKTYKMASFTVSLYDAGGKLLDTASILMSNISNGDTKSWSEYVLDLEPQQVASYRFQFDTGL